MHLPSHLSTDINAKFPRPHTFDLSFIAKMRYFSFFAAAFAVASSAATVLPRQNPLDPNPAEVDFTTVMAGSGCPANTFTTNVSDDAKTVNLTFSSFDVAVDRFSEGQDDTKSCGIRLEAKHPEGFQLAINSIVWSGWARLDSGVDLSLLLAPKYGDWAATSRVYISGGGNTAGGLLFAKEDAAPGSWPVYSPCGTGAVLNMMATVIMVQGNPLGAGSTDDGTSSSPPVTLGVNLVWKPCPA